MQFSNYDFIDSKSFAGKIILTSFPGLNPSGLFEEKILANELEIFKNNNCSSITSFVEDSEFEKLCDKTFLSKVFMNIKYICTIYPSMTWEHQIKILNINGKQQKFY